MKKNSADSRKARAMLTLSRGLVYALLIFLSILCLFSFYMLIINASRTNADLQGGFKALPQGHFLENLKNAWNDSSINIPRGMLNSFIVAATTAILSTYFSALTAYGLHAYQFKLKRVAFLFIMAVMVIPKQVSAAGFVQLCYKLKLTNSYLPLILPGIAAPVVFFYMIQYMKSVLPMEIVEAARGWLGRIFYLQPHCAPHAQARHFRAADLHVRRVLEQLLPACAASRQGGNEDGSDHDRAAARGGLLEV